MELQKRFIADAAHQMKTPLAGLRTQAELALRQDVSTEVQRSLEQIATSSEHAARLVTQLLALARAENRVTGQIFSRVELTDLARHRGARLGAGRAREADGHRLRGAAAAGRSGRQPVMLREMLSNLIDNAIRYTPTGGRITVRVRLDEGDLDLVHLEVEDTGLGIPPAERAARRRALLPDSRSRGRRQRTRARDRPGDRDDARRHAHHRRPRLSGIAAARRNAGPRQLAAGLSCPGQTLIPRFKHDHSCFEKRDN